MNWTLAAYVIASGLLILSVMRASRKYDAMLIERKNRLNAQVGNESPGSDYDTRLPKYSTGEPDEQAFMLDTPLTLHIWTPEAPKILQGKDRPAA